MGRFGRWAGVGVLALGLAGGVASGLAGPRPGDPVPPMDPPEPLPARVAEPTPALKPAAAVALVWTNPAEVRVNRPAPYTLTVTNTGPEPVQQVVVQVRVPAGVTASDAKPPAKTVGGVLLWELGTLAAGEAKPLAMSFASPTKGSLTADAWVTCTGSAATTVQVREPKLEAFIEAPATVEIGEVYRVVYGARNTGDAPLDDVVLVPKPTHGPDSGVFAGATHARVSAVPPGGERIEDTLEAATTPGVHTYELTVIGADELKATATVNVRVLAPKLAVTVDGPAELGVGKSGTYRVRVTNTGDSEAEDVSLTADFAGGVKAALRCRGEVIQIGAVNPPLGLFPCRPDGFTLRPGEMAGFIYDGQAATPGAHVHTFAVAEKRGITAMAECRTVVKGVPGIRMEVVDSADPLKVGEETTYEVKVLNTGTAADRNLVLSCDLPPGMTLVKADGPVPHLERIGVDFERNRMTTLHTVTFEPVRELGPKTEVVFQVKVRATAAGAAKFTARLASDHLTTAVVKEESTTVYGD